MMRYLAVCFFAFGVLSGPAGAATTPATAPSPVPSMAAETEEGQAAKINGITLLRPKGDYTQKATGMVFPASVGEFERINVARYAEDGTDESAGYLLDVPMQETNATIYVFPSLNTAVMSWPKNEIARTRARLCESQFKSIEGEVMGAHPDAVPQSEAKVIRIQGRAKYIGHKAVYTLSYPTFFGRTNVVSASEVYVFCYAGGKWTVEYRVDYPVEYDASKLVSSFMRDLRWTIPREK